MGLSTLIGGGVGAQCLLPGGTDEAEGDDFLVVAIDHSLAQLR